MGNELESGKPERANQRFEGRRGGRGGRGGNDQPPRRRNNYQGGDGEVRKYNNPRYNQHLSLTPPLTLLLSNLKIQKELMKLRKKLLLQLNQKSQLNQRLLK